MSPELRTDLLAILLEEIVGWPPEAARALVTRGPRPGVANAGDNAALDQAVRVLRRFEERLGDE